MKKAIFIVFQYCAAILSAGVFTAIAAFPHLPIESDFSRQDLAVFFVILSGFYIGAYAFIVIVVNIIIHSIDGHRFLPKWSIPLFGALFPLIGITLFPTSWWPDKNATMDTQHLIAFTLASASALGLVGLVSFTKNNIRSRSRKMAMQRKNDQ